MPSDLDIQRTRELKIRNDEMEKRLKNPQAPAQVAMPQLPEGAMNNPQFLKGYTDFMNTDRKGPSDPMDIQQRAIMAGLTAAANTGVSRDEATYKQKQAGVLDPQQANRLAYETGQAGLEKTQGEAAEKTGLSSYYSGLGEKERAGAESQRAPADFARGQGGIAGLHRQGWSLHVCCFRKGQCLWQFGGVGEACF